MQRKTKEILDLSEMEEGKLYVKKNEEVSELKIDKDNYDKVRVSDEAIDEIIKIQKQMRQKMEGYKPDVVAVASALVIEGASDEDRAFESVRSFVKSKFDKIS